MIDEYSADAVRFTLVMLSSEGQDINLSENSFEIGRNFSNKIWNAYRFLSMHLESIDTDYTKYQADFELADQWILSRFHQTIKKCTDNLDRYKVNDSLNEVYQFFWHDYCDWYLELIKKRLYQKEQTGSRKAALALATHIMKESMNLLHPFMPFISEEIWQSLKIDDDQSIVICPWPAFEDEYINENVNNNMNFLQEAISSIRNIRAEMNVPPAKTASLFIRGDKTKMKLIHEYGSYFQSLAKIEKIEDSSESIEHEVIATAVVQAAELFVPLADLIDIDKEKMRLEKEISRLQGLQKGFSAKLSNENFINKAPEKVVKAEQEKLANIEENLDKVRNNYNNLQRK